MKKLVIVTAVASVLTACGTSGTNYSAQYSNQHSIQASQMSNAISQAPEWMSKLPKAAGYVFENGTATSTDFGFADIKAKTIAYSKICTSAGGKVRSQTKLYRADNGDAGTESSEMAVRSMCADVDISGVETVEMKHVADGNRIRTYVLVALPTSGFANKDAKRGAKEAFKELDNMTREQKNESQIEITPVAPAKGQEVSVVRPDGTTSTLNLMPVDNAEYKARRAEALQKPGAVVGQVTIAN
jgi:hydrogenase maturation factor